MEILGPFEPAPLLAVAFSGGGDSLALLLLADAWAQARGGAVLALTVDHGLRAESASEAVQAAALCAARGIAHRTLRWEGDKPATRLQEKARAARYALLEQACADAGALHLLLAHHADDQAETIALRAEAKSGPRGLAGMATERFTRTVRHLRPLLDVPKARLLSTCRAAGLGWIEDPSNTDPRFARARLRTNTSAARLRANVMAARLRANVIDARLRADVMDARLLVEDVSHAEARHTGDEAAAALAARIAVFDPQGFVRLERAGLDAASPALAGFILARIVQAVGAGAFAPGPSLEGELVAWARTGMWKGRAQARITAGRCLLKRGAAHMVVAREARRLPPPVSLVPGDAVLWDRRVLAGAEAPGFALGALGPRGWESARATGIDLPPLPPEARASLPVVRSQDGQIVDWLGRASDRFARPMENPPAESPTFDAHAGTAAAEFGAFLRLVVPPAFPAAFTVVWPPRRIMF